MKKPLRRLLVALSILVISLTGLYGLLAAPPLFFFFPQLPDAGPGSVYVPGSGFAGFWYHVGLFSNYNLSQVSDIYCYSSGCLSVVLATLPIQQVHAVALSVQQSWMAGSLHQYEIVPAFLQQLDLPKHQSQLQRLLPNLKVLVTSWNGAVVVEEPTTIDDLQDFLLQTTYIPFVTGPARFLPTSNDFVLDGGFSRSLHPKCDLDIRVPVTWRTTLYTLTPGISTEQVVEFWEMGRNDAARVLSDDSSATERCQQGVSIHNTTVF